MKVCGAAAGHWLLSVEAVTQLYISTFVLINRPLANEVGHVTELQL